ncbi:MAG: response regulator [Bdellovibrionales bacterium]
MAKVNLNIELVVIDDDNQVLEVLVEYLEYFGLASIKAFSKSTMAMQYIQDTSNNIDLIISDWEMKDLSGLDILKGLRANPSRSKTPFIMVTSQSSIERMKITQAMQTGVDGYIVKPFRAEVLKDKIWNVMEWESSDDLAG